MKQLPEECPVHIPCGDICQQCLGTFDADTHTEKDKVVALLKKLVAPSGSVTRGKGVMLQCLYEDAADEGVLILDCSHLKQPRYLGELFRLEVVEDPVDVYADVVEHVFHARVCQGGMFGPQLLSETDVALLLVAGKRKLFDLRWRRSTSDVCIARSLFGAREDNKRCQIAWSVLGG